MTPYAGSAQVLTRSSFVRRVACARSQRCAALSWALLPARACHRRSFQRLVPPAVARPRAPLAPQVLVESP